MNFFGEMVENLHASTATAHEKGDQVIALLESMEARLGDLFEAITAETDQDEYFPLTFTNTTDGTGAGSTTVQRKPGFVSELVSLSVVGLQSPGGILVYINDASPTNLVYAGAISSFFTDQFPEGTVVPDGANLVVVANNGGATVNYTVTIRSRRKMLDRAQMKNIQHL